MGDLSGKTIVVTGANSGLGYEATAAFVEHGAHVVLACRSTERGQAAKERIQESKSTDGTMRVLELDLAALDSIRSFVETFETEYETLHALCNNAGVMAIPRQETADGFEMQFGVNHLGHFALTGLLLETLIETEGETRVVTQSSGVHERGRIEFEDLHGEESYDKWGAYSQSKLANLLFAYELQRRLDGGIEDVVSVGCHPGYAATNLQRRGPEQSGSTLGLWGMKAANALLAQDPAQGALPMLYGATETEITGGEYVGPGGFMNMRGYPEIQRSSDRSYDKETAQQLWSVSEELTGVTYDLS